jgi:hypothetical protein
MEYMKGLTPSGVELEIMTLSTFNFGQDEEMNSSVHNFFDVLASTIAANKDADYTQALINCVLKTHNEVILEDKELMVKAEEVVNASKKSLHTLQELINQNLCMVSHFTGVVMK